MAHRRVSDELAGRFYRKQHDLFRQLGAEEMPTILALATLQRIIDRQLLRGGRVYQVNVDTSDYSELFNQAGLRVLDKASRLTDVEMAHPGLSCLRIISYSPLNPRIDEIERELRACRFRFASLREVIALWQLYPDIISLFGQLIALGTMTKRIPEPDEPVLMHPYIAEHQDGPTVLSIRTGEEHKLDSNFSLVIANL